MSKKEAKASLGKKGFSQLRKNEKQKQKARQVIPNRQRVNYTYSVGTIYNGASLRNC